jgi:hypothetical protein
MDLRKDTYAPGEKIANSFSRFHAVHAIKYDLFDIY